jgi:hypothetical protein
MSDTLSVPRVRLSSLSVQEFRDQYMLPNKPVLLTGATAAWRAVREWVSADGQPNVQELANAFGNSMVSVVGRNGGRRQMTVAEYAGWWEARETSSDPEDVLYLKDWHLPQVTLGLKLACLLHY